MYILQHIAFHFSHLFFVVKNLRFSPVFLVGNQFRSSTCLSALHRHKPCKLSSSSVMRKISPQIFFNYHLPTGFSVFMQCSMIAVCAFMSLTEFYIQKFMLWISLRPRTVASSENKCSRWKIIPYVISGHLCLSKSFISRLLKFPLEGCHSGFLWISFPTRAVHVKITLMDL